MGEGVAKISSSQPLSPLTGLRREEVGFDFSSYSPLLTKINESSEEVKNQPAGVRQAAINLILRAKIADLKNNSAEAELARKILVLICQIAGEENITAENVLEKIGQNNFPQYLGNYLKKCQENYSGWQFLKRLTGQAPDSVKDQIKSQDWRADEIKAINLVLSGVVNAVRGDAPAERLARWILTRLLKESGAYRGEAAILSYREILQNIKFGGQPVFTPENIQNLENVRFDFSNNWLELNTRYQSRIKDLEKAYITRSISAAREKTAESKETEPDSVSPAIISVHPFLDPAGSAALQEYNRRIAQYKEALINEIIRLISLKDSERQSLPQLAILSRHADEVKENLIKALNSYGLASFLKTGWTREISGLFRKEDWGKLLKKEGLKIDQFLHFQALLFYESLSDDEKETIRANISGNPPRALEEIRKTDPQAGRFLGDLDFIENLKETIEQAKKEKSPEISLMIKVSEAAQKEAAERKIDNLLSVFCPDLIEKESITGGAGGQKIYRVKDTQIKVNFNVSVEDKDAQKEKAKKKETGFELSAQGQELLDRLSSQEQNLLLQQLKDLGFVLATKPVRNVKPGVLLDTPEQLLAEVVFAIKNNPHPDSSQIKALLYSALVLFEKSFDKASADNLAKIYQGWSQRLNSYQNTQAPSLSSVSFASSLAPRVINLPGSPLHGNLYEFYFPINRDDPDSTRIKEVWVLKRNAQGELKEATPEEIQCLQELLKSKSSQRNVNFQTSGVADGRMVVLMKNFAPLVKPHQAALEVTESESLVVDSFLRRLSAAGHTHQEKLNQSLMAMFALYFIENQAVNEKVLKVLASIGSAAYSGRREAPDFSERQQDIIGIIIQENLNPQEIQTVVQYLKEIEGFPADFREAFFIAANLFFESKESKEAKNTREEIKFQHFKVADLLKAVASAAFILENNGRQNYLNALGIEETPKQKEIIFRSKEKVRQKILPSMQEATALTYFLERAGNDTAKRNAFSSVSSVVFDQEFFQLLTNPTFTQRVEMKVASSPEAVPAAISERKEEAPVNLSELGQRAPFTIIKLFLRGMGFSRVTDPKDNYLTPTDIRILAEVLAGEDGQKIVFSFEGLLLNYESFVAALSLVVNGQIKPEVLSANCQNYLKELASKVIGEGSRSGFLIREDIEHLNAVKNELQRMLSGERLKNELVELQAKVKNDDGYNEENKKQILAYLQKLQEFINDGKGTLEDLQEGAVILDLLKSEGAVSASLWCFLQLYLSLSEVIQGGNTDEIIRNGIRRSFFRRDLSLSAKNRQVLLNYAASLEKKPEAAKFLTYMRTPAEENERKAFFILRNLAWQLDQVDLLADKSWNEQLGWLGGLARRTGWSFLNNLNGSLQITGSRRTSSLVNIPRMRLSGEQAWQPVMLLKMALQPEKINQLQTLSQELEKVRQEIEVFSQKVDKLTGESSGKKLAALKRQNEAEYQKLVNLLIRESFLRRKLLNIFSELTEPRIDENFIRLIGPAINKAFWADKFMAYFLGQQIIIYKPDGTIFDGNEILASPEKTFKFLTETIQKDGGWSTLAILPGESVDTTLAKMVLTRLIFDIPLDNSEVNWGAVGTSALVLLGGRGKFNKAVFPFINALFRGTGRGSSNIPAPDSREIFSSKNLIWRRLSRTFEMMSNTQPAASLGANVKFFNWQYSNKRSQDMAASVASLADSLRQFNLVNSSDVSQAITNLNELLREINRSPSSKQKIKELINSGNSPFTNLQIDNTGDIVWRTPPEDFVNSGSQINRSAGQQEATTGTLVQAGVNLSTPQTAGSEKEKVFSQALIDGFALLGLVAAGSDLAEAKYQPENTSAYLMTGLKKEFGQSQAQSVPQVLVINQYEPGTFWSWLGVTDPATPEREAPVSFNWRLLELPEGVLKEALPWQTMPLQLGWGVFGIPIAGAIQGIKGDDTAARGSALRGFEDGLATQALNSGLAIVKFGTLPTVGISRINNIWRTRKDDEFWGPLGASLFWGFQIFASTVNLFNTIYYLERRARGLEAPPHTSLAFGTGNIFRGLGRLVEGRAIGTRFDSVGQEYDRLYNGTLQFLQSLQELEVSSDKTRMNSFIAWLNRHPYLAETGRFGVNFFYRPLIEWPLQLARLYPAALGSQYLRNSLGWAIDFFYRVPERNRQRELIRRDLGLTPDQRIPRRVVYSRYGTHQRPEISDYLHGAGSFIIESNVTTVEGDQGLKIFQPVVERFRNQSLPLQFFNEQGQPVKCGLLIGKITVVEGSEINVRPYQDTSGAEWAEIIIGRERLMHNGQVLSGEGLASLGREISRAADSAVFVSGGSISEVLNTFNFLPPEPVRVAVPGGEPVTITAEQRTFVEKIAWEALNCFQNVLQQRVEAIRNTRDRDGAEQAIEEFRNLQTQTLQGLDLQSRDGRMKMLALTRANIYLFGREPESLRYSNLLMTQTQMEAIAFGYLGLSFNKECGGGKTAITFGINANRWVVDNKASYSFTTDALYARRDADCFDLCYRALGIKVGVVEDIKAYTGTTIEQLNRPVVYGSLYDFNFLHLISQTTSEAALIDFRRHYTADEGEYYFIDMSRTPLIISTSKGNEPAPDAQTWKAVAEAVKDYFGFNPKMRRTGGRWGTTGWGRWCNFNNPATENHERQGVINFVRGRLGRDCPNNIEYYVNICLEGIRSIENQEAYLDWVHQRVVVINQNMQKIEPDMRLSEGRHQALEALAGFKILRDLEVIQSETPQQFLLRFRGDKVFISGTINVPEVMRFFNRAGFTVMELGRNVSEQDFRPNDTAVSLRQELNRRMNLQRDTAGADRLDIVTIGGQDQVPVRIVVNREGAEAAQLGLPLDSSASDRTLFTAGAPQDFRHFLEITEVLATQRVQNAAGTEFPLVPSVILVQRPELVASKQEKAQEIARQISAEIEYVIANYDSGARVRPILIQTGGDQEFGEMMEQALTEVRRGLRRTRLRDPRAQRIIESLLGSGRVRRIDFQHQTGQQTRNQTVQQAGTLGVTIGSFARADDIRVDRNSLNPVDGQPLGPKGVRRGILLFMTGVTDSPWSYWQARERAGRFIDSAEIRQIWSLDDKNIPAEVRTQVAVLFHQGNTQEAIERMRTAQTRRATGQAEEGLLSQAFQNIDARYERARALFIEGPQTAPTPGTDPSVALRPRRQVDVAECVQTFLSWGIEGIINNHRSSNGNWSGTEARRGAVLAAEQLTRLLGIRIRVTDLENLPQNLTNQQIVEQLVNQIMTDLGPRLRNINPHAPQSGFANDERQGRLHSVRDLSWQQLLHGEIFGEGNKQLGIAGLLLGHRLRAGWINEAGWQQLSETVPSQIQPILERRLAIIADGETNDTWVSAKAAALDELWRQLINISPNNETISQILRQYREALSQIPSEGEHQAQRQQLTQTTVNNLLAILEADYRTSLLRGQIDREVQRIDFEDRLNTAKKVIWALRQNGIELPQKINFRNFTAPAAPPGPRPPVRPLPHEPGREAPPTPVRPSNPGEVTGSAPVPPPLPPGAKEAGTIVWEGVDRETRAGTLRLGRSQGRGQEILEISQEQQAKLGRLLTDLRRSPNEVPLLFRYIEGADGVKVFERLVFPTQTLSCENKATAERVFGIISRCQNNEIPPVTAAWQLTEILGRTITAEFVGQCQAISAPDYCAITEQFLREHPDSIAAHFEPQPIALSGADRTQRGLIIKFRDDGDLEIRVLSFARATPGRFRSPNIQETVEAKPEAFAGRPPLPSESGGVVVVKTSKTQTPEDFSKVLLEIESLPEGSHIHFESEEKIRVVITPEQAAALKNERSAYSQFIEKISAGPGQPELAIILDTATQNQDFRSFLENGGVPETEITLEGEKIKFSRSNGQLRITGQGQTFEIEEACLLDFLRTEKIISEIMENTVKTNPDLDPDQVRARVFQSLIRLVNNNGALTEIPLVVIDQDREDFLTERIAVQKDGRRFEIRISNKTISKLLVVDPLAADYEKVLGELRAEIEKEMAKGGLSDQGVTAEDFLTPLTQRRVFVENQGKTVSLILNHRTLARLARCAPGSPEFKEALAELNRELERAQENLKQIGLDADKARWQIRRNLFLQGYSQIIAGTLKEVLPQVSDKIYEEELKKINPQGQDVEKEIEKAQKKAQQRTLKIVHQLSPEAVISEPATKTDAGVLENTDVNNFLAERYQKVVGRQLREGLPQLKMPAASGKPFNVREQLGTWKWLCLGAPGGGLGMKTAALGRGTLQGAAEGLVASAIFSGAKNLAFHGFKGEWHTAWLKSKEEIVAMTLGWAEFSAETAAAQAFFGFTGHKPTAFAFFLNTHRSIKSAPREEKLLAAGTGMVNFGAFIGSERLTSKLIQVLPLPKWVKWVKNPRVTRSLSTVSGMLGADLSEAGIEKILRKNPNIRAFLTSDKMAALGEYLETGSQAAASKFYVQFGLKLINLGSRSLRFLSKNLPKAAGRAAGWSAVLAVVSTDAVARATDLIAGTSELEKTDRRDLYENWYRPFVDEEIKQKNQYVRQVFKWYTESFFTKNYTAGLQALAEGKEGEIFFSSLRRSDGLSQGLGQLVLLGHLDENVILNDRIFGPIFDRVCQRNFLNFGKKQGEQFLLQRRILLKIFDLIKQAKNGKISQEKLPAELKKIIISHFVSSPETNAELTALLLKALNDKGNAQFFQIMNQREAEIGQPGQLLRKEVSEQLPLLFKDYLAGTYAQYYQNQLNQIMSRFFISFAELPQEEQNAFKAFYQLQGLAVENIKDPIDFLKKYFMFKIRTSANGAQMVEAEVNLLAENQIHQILATLTFDKLMAGAAGEGEKTKTEFQQFLSSQYPRQGATQPGQSREMTNTTLTLATARNSESIVLPTGRDLIEKFAEFLLSHQGIEPYLSQEEIEAAFGKIQDFSQIPTPDLLKISGPHQTAFLNEAPNLIEGFRKYLENKFGNNLYEPQRQPGYSTLMADSLPRMRHDLFQGISRTRLADCFLRVLEKAEIAFGQGQYDVGLAYYARIMTVDIAQPARQQQIRERYALCLKKLKENSLTRDMIMGSIQGASRPITEADIDQALVVLCQQKAFLLEIKKHLESVKEVDKARKIGEQINSLTNSFSLNMPPMLQTKTVDVSSLLRRGQVLNTSPSIQSKADTQVTKVIEKKDGDTATLSLTPLSQQQSRRIYPGEFSSLRTDIPLPIGLGVSALPPGLFRREPIQPNSPIQPQSPRFSLNEDNGGTKPLDLSQLPRIKP